MDARQKSVNYQRLLEINFTFVILCKSKHILGEKRINKRSRLRPKTQFNHLRKFYVSRKNNKVVSIETGRIVIAHLLP